ncbi:hypothetical protein O181_034040 [Austropuccinia psidii MF-1]|uniref:Uncharacterized protein n=1 Tax=Austropuccinia psidii MF-1 TaxID=1389203 RepID=A0A9Q3D2C1_9BASI|nr:hypothetical protein [Austropuccinia psidii MF-1]
MHRTKPAKSPLPGIPHKQTLGQRTPGPSGTQWSEELFHNKQPNKPLLISTFKSSELTLPPFVEPSQSNEPPIPGPSQSSKPHEEAPTHEPKREVDPAQSMEEHFARCTTPPSVIIIDNMPVGSPPLPVVPPPSTPTQEIPPISPKNPTTSFPPGQAPFNHKMRLGRNLRTCD